ncbi:autotransporter assembly complex protein TamA [Comamonas endophytica]|uniref:Autotransporter assembly complex protein TamA n=1 Tax=Comamonas endophytica TaxID=2949090 RepID=A0ABY6G6P6_9BURK|nr:MULTISPECIES: autotransporter assembly complex family protein [unclassified Acidovorax]MCD2511302.1 autotransporter assembly complex protein TamA [Acidovorax sp. D4N7]UYG50696.1 autotransporter assembly complex protein TamA [Acidovorax sp. 5MLIR]
MPLSLPTQAPAIRSAFLLTAALLLSGCSLLSKEKSRDAQAVSSVTGPPSFALQVEAPDDVRELLTKHMELQRFRQQPDLQRRELSRLLGAADKNIRSLIGTLGYFSPTIALEIQEAPEASEERYVVIVRVDPGPPAQISTAQVTFSGPTANDAGGATQRALIQNTWPLKPGQRFTQSAWGGAKSQGLRSLQQRRYPTAAIASSQAVIDADTQEAQLDVNYAPGPAYTFGALRIEGGQRYDTEGTARIARLPEGREYSQQEMLDAQQRLASSGYYDSVFLTLDTSAAQPESTAVTAPVIAQVREAQLQKWVLGVGVSTDSGPRLSVDHIHNRLPFIGWRAVTKANINKKNPLLSTNWTALPDQTGWAWFTGAKAEREETGDFDTNSLQLRAGRSRSEDRIDRNYYLQYDYARQQGGEELPSSSSITANYGWTGRYFDSPTNPTSGHGFAWEVGAGTTLTPTREPFGRVSARWLSLIGIGERDEVTLRRSRLALRAAGGAVIARDDVAIPVTQLFLTGGDTTVRGYSYQSIGARTENGLVTGGRYLAAGSIEWQRPITVRGNTSDWESTLFLDAGTVTDNLDAMNVRAGVGTGIRWRSPVGPVQADIAYGLQSQRLRLHLRLGFTF